MSFDPAVTPNFENSTMQFPEIEEFENRINKLYNSSKSLPRGDRAVALQQLQAYANKILNELSQLTQIGIPPEAIRIEAKNSLLTFNLIEQNFSKNNQTFEQRKVDLKKDFEVLNRKIANCGKNLNFTHFAAPIITKKGNLAKDPLLSYKSTEFQVIPQDYRSKKNDVLTLSCTNEKVVRDLKANQPELYEYLKKENLIPIPIIEKLETSTVAAKYKQDFWKSFDDPKVTESKTEKTDNHSNSLDEPNRVKDPVLKEYSEKINRTKQASDKLFEDIQEMLLNDDDDDFDFDIDMDLL